MHPFKVVRSRLRRWRLMRERAKRDEFLHIVWNTHRRSAYVTALRLASQRGDVIAGLMLMCEVISEGTDRVVAALAGVRA